MDYLYLICKMKFGSHLYGTNTPESDTDYKGVFMPTITQILINEIPKTLDFNTKNTKKEGVKNTKDDIDCQYFSLHYFIKQALRGETEAIDMLHAPFGIEQTSEIWCDLQRNREKFYTKNLSAFVSYARKQAAKYGVKGSRLATAKIVLDTLLDIGNKIEYITNKPSERIKLSGIWNELPKREHIHFLTDENNPNIRMYQVCGKKFQETCTIEHVYNILKNFYDNYGDRAKLAEKNEGIDWKAVSHALRAAYQLIHIYEDGGFTYPLPEAYMLKQVKQGLLNYKNEVAPLLDEKITYVEKLAEKSKYPDKPDIKFFRTWLKKTMYEFVYMPNEKHPINFTKD